jgi:hypothetical protein
MKFLRWAIFAHIAERVNFHISGLGPTGLPTGPARNLPHPRGGKAREKEDSMMKLGPIIDRTQVADFMSIRCTHPEDCLTQSPVECELHTLYIPEVGDVREVVTKGHIGSSAWFEGMNRYHEPVTIAHETVTGQTIFWSGNNNNGREVLFCPEQRPLFPFTAFAMSPHHETWQPDKVILFTFESDHRKKIQLYRETLDLVYQYRVDKNKARWHYQEWDQKVLTGLTQNLGTYLATAGHFRHGNYFHYIHAAKFLQRIGFDIPEIAF